MFLILSSMSETYGNSPLGIRAGRDGEGENVLYGVQGTEVQVTHWTCIRRERESKG